METWKIIILILTLIIASILLYFFIGFIGYGFSLRRKNFSSSRYSRMLYTRKENLKIDFSWWDKHRAVYLEIRSKENLKLCAHFIKAAQKSENFVILVHGFGATYKEMQRYAELFYKMNYNILAVENRAHGNSQGKFVGMGLYDKDDVLRWINKLLKIYGENIKIVLFGVSMGGATVTMSSGDELPKNVKCIISDCAYTNILYELKHVAKRKSIFFVPAIYCLMGYMKIFHNFTLKDGDAIKFLQNSQTPILFIHGANDDFVPTNMVYKLYDAAPLGKKDILVVYGAGHAQSIITNPKLYENKIKEFLETWI